MDWSYSMHATTLSSHCILHDSALKKENRYFEELQIDPATLTASK